MRLLYFLLLSEVLESCISFSTVLPVFRNTPQKYALIGLRGGGKSVGFSAMPGTLEKEEQKVLTPLGPNSFVLVVGASRGIGLEFVSKLLDKGCKVIGTHRGIEAPPGLKNLSDQDGKLSFLSMDVGDEQSIIQAASDLRARMNAEKNAGLTHVIHNAGVYGPRDTFDGSGAATKAGLLSTFEINAVGPLLVAQSFVPLMCKPKSATEGMPILALLTSKVGSVDDNNSGGAYSYRASKSALNIIAKSLFNDLAGRVAVFLLHPGYVRTDMTGGNGLIDADESVTGMIKAIEATDGATPFRWVDFKACRIPW